MPKPARNPLSQRNCSWARTLDLIGDKWSMMIIRETMGGPLKFSELERRIGLAKNILSQRLEHLCAEAILDRVPQRAGSPRFSYGLTAKGYELFPVIVALGQWGDKWLFGAQGQPVVIVDKASGAPVQQVAVFSHDGRYLTPDQADLIPGPGADETTRAFLEQRKAAG